MGASTAAAEPHRHQRIRKLLSEGAAGHSSVPRRNLDSVVAMELVG